ncbi:MAG: DUF881 domain-containing protein [Clostridia bacterium]|nr:DUF881 domain-containing protein [Clostridia bacterium]
MKSEKITMLITIGIACFCLILIMFMQFKVVNETDITNIETMRESELRDELANWKTKYEEAEKNYTETSTKIQEYVETKESNEETEKLMNEELEKVNLILGATDVKGQGIEVIINKGDEEYSNESIADDILVIVNSLKISGAEAISINDERIINMSDIAIITSEFIKVNGKRILAPYKIKAIGEPTYLESGLIGNGGKVEAMKKLGQDVKIIKNDNLEIGKYNKTISTKYMED